MLYICFCNVTEIRTVYCNLCHDHQVIKNLTSSMRGQCMEYKIESNLYYKRSEKFIEQ